MTMQATSLPSAEAAELVRRVQCGFCWRPGPSEACTPEGDHFARWARARRKGLISADQIGAALDSLIVITDGAIVGRSA
jgi:hypothetical protein